MGKAARLQITSQGRKKNVGLRLRTSMLEQLASKPELGENFRVID